MTAFRVRILRGKNGKVVVQQLKYEPQWETIAVLTPKSFIQTPRGMKPAGKATDEEIIAAVVADKKAPA